MIWLHFLLLYSGTFAFLFHAWWCFLTERERGCSRLCLWSWLKVIAGARLAGAGASWPCHQLTAYGHLRPPLPLALILRHAAALPYIVSQALASCPLDHMPCLPLLYRVFRAAIHWVM